ncbi:MAG: serine O-acetyltransferase [Pseudonocardiales bacterium]|nr:serine O-acetyltransferase [Pseudonocardiales bacterium]
MSELSFLQLVRADIEATTHPNFRNYSNRRFWLRAIAKLVVTPAVRVVVMYRISHVLAGKGLLPVALLIRARGIRVSGAELHPQATVGPGLYLPHSIGAGFGAYTTIGANCTLQAGAAVGPQPHGADERLYTTVGDNVYIGLHAVIIAGVTIGDGAVIGANAVVMRDVDPYTVIAASPGRVVAKRPEASRVS